jgi:hypothetical protein
MHLGSSKIARASKNIDTPLSNQGGCCLRFQCPIMYSRGVLVLIFYFHVALGAKVNLFLDFRL